MRSGERKDNSAKGRLPAALKTSRRALPLRDRMKGQTMAEYALILVLLASGVALGFKYLSKLGSVPGSVGVDMAVSPDQLPQATGPDSGTGQGSR